VSGEGSNMSSYSHSRKSFSAGPPACPGRWAGDSRADSAAGAELQGAPQKKVTAAKKYQKYHWVKHKDMLICCFDVSLDM
jgi:hypothetical protein